MRCVVSVVEWNISAVQSGVDEFRSQDFGLKLNWEAPMGSDLVFYSVSRMER
jgi:hypothetical protein